jgi:LysM repeat protein
MIWNEQFKSSSIGSKAMRFYKSVSIGIVSSMTILTACGGGSDDPAGDLAALAGQLATSNDLREVKFADLDGDGRREVMLVYGPRELLNFDVYYRDGETWRITPPVNDRNNPREFVSTNLDSVVDINGDGINEMQLSSRLYDGNTMVKEVRWSPEGYEVIGQRTVIAMSEPQQQSAPQSRPSSTATQQSSPGTQATTQAAPAQTQAAAPEPEPVAEAKIPAIIPSWGTYTVKKGDTLIGVARALGSSLDELERYNHNQLQARGLRVGQRINVPVPSKPGKGVKVKINKEYYTVRSGDTLSGVSDKQGVSVRALKSWNHDIPGDGTIKVGQRLAIHHAVVTIG